jgi:hypothetical protein
MIAERSDAPGKSMSRLNNAYVWTTYAAFCLAIALVNATSAWMETDGRLWQQLVDELTSVSAIFVLTPFVILLILHLEGLKASWLQISGAHLCNLAVFSGLHIVAMVLLRTAIYPLFGSYYADNRSIVQLTLYEGRKDALVYVCLALATHAIIRFFQPESMAVTAKSGQPPSVRIVHRDGAMRTFIPAQEILWVEAAGNYIELILQSRRLLQRRSLRVIEAELSEAGFIRIHRSRIINPVHIRSLVEKGNGDFTLVFANGQEVGGSRRFRNEIAGRI